MWVKVEKAVSVRDTGPEYKALRHPRAGTGYKRRLG